MWGRRPHTIFIPPTKLVVQWRNGQALSKKPAHRIRSQVSFRVLPQVSIQGNGRKTQEAIARNDQRSLQYDGDRDRAGENHGRPRARVFIGAAKVFPGRSDETDQGQQFGETVSRISRAQEALLGTAFLGTGIFREHGGSQRRNDQKIHQGSEASRESTSLLEIGSHRRSRWWFTGKIIGC